MDEDIEPYVRRKKGEGTNRRKMETLNEDEQNVLRNAINSRERKRMHELNDEFDALRNCLPYSNDTSVRRMSKANTLLLATNWILNLKNTNANLLTENTMLKAQINFLMSQSAAGTNSSTVPQPSFPPSHRPCYCVNCIIKEQQQKSGEGEESGNDQ
ncbi:hypothetical protein WR25_06783 [Diploscapter pachys]|uniref:BHLH domain-containing protein n=1 Tax=Diploscapter pachys TaxID=2018661 RepID=A0A2A2KE37_9BILA|nr:hypothetical protein WR25_06783 [Diploscapter pachys]